MTDFLRNDAFAIMLLIFAYWIVLSVISFRSEMAFASRKKICYNTFQKYAPQFNRKVNYKMVWFLLGGVAASIVVGIMLLLDPVTSIFVWAFLPINLTAGLFVYSNLTVKKYNKDLGRFEEYYKNISSGIENKNEMLANANRVASKVASEKRVLLDDWTDINKCFGNTIGEVITRLFLPLEEKIDSYINMLNSTSGKNITEFDTQLSKHLSGDSGVNVSLSFFNQSDDMDVSLQLGDIRSQYKAIRRSAFMTNVVEKSHCNDDIFVAVFNRLIAEQVLFSGGEVEQLLEYIDFIVTDGQPKIASVFDTLYANGYISVQNVLDTIVPKEYYWAVSATLLETLGERDFMQIFETVAKNNLLKICNALLPYVGSVHISTIDKVLLTLKPNQHTQSSRLLSAHRMIAANQYGFFDDATKLENMTFALLQYMGKQGKSHAQNLQLVEKIIENDTYWQNAEAIEKIYTHALQHCESVFSVILNLYVNYQSGFAAQNNLLDSKKIVAVLQEYKATLMVEEITILGLLLASLIFVMEYNVELLQSTLDCVKKLGFNETFLSDSPTENGEVILAALINEKGNKAKNVLNRIESERLTLDKMRRMWS